MPQLQAGDIAENTIVSPVTADIEPKELPPKSREELYRRVAPVFDYDETTIPVWVQNWVQAFTTVRQKYFNDDTAKGIPQLQLMDHR